MLDMNSQSDLASFRMVDSKIVTPAPLCPGHTATRTTHHSAVHTHFGKTLPRLFFGYQSVYPHLFSTLRVESISILSGDTLLYIELIEEQLKAAKRECWQERPVLELWDWSRWALISACSFDDILHLVRFVEIQPSRLPSKRSGRWLFALVIGLL